MSFQLPAPCPTTTTLPPRSACRRPSCFASTLTAHAVLRWAALEWDELFLNVLREFNEINLRNSRFGSKHNSVPFYARDRGALYSLPLMVLKSSASASDADSAAKIDSAVFQYFTGGGFCLFCSPHGNDKVI